MILIAINNEQYKLPENWHEITIANGIKLHELIKTMPEKLSRLYRLQAEGKDRRSKEFKQLEDSIDTDDLIKHFPVFYGKVIALLGNVPNKVMKYTLPSERSVIYKHYLESFVLGIMFTPVDYQPQNIEQFEFEEHTYHLPKSRVDGNGETIPGGWMETIEFTEAADLLRNATSIEEGVVSKVPMLIAIMCRKKGEKYDEERVIQRAKDFERLPLSVAWEVLFFSMHYTTTYVKDLEMYFKEMEVSSI